MHSILLIAFSCLLAAQALARDASAVSQIPLDECDLRAVIGALTYETIKNEGAIAKEKSPILDQIKTLIRKARYNNVPLRDQLSPDDIAQFSELRQRLMTMELASLIESQRERDLKAI